MLPKLRIKQHIASYRYRQITHFRLLLHQPFDWQWLYILITTTTTRSSPQPTLDLIHTIHTLHVPPRTLPRSHCMCLSGDGVLAALFVHAYGSVTGLLAFEMAEFRAGDWRIRRTPSCEVEGRYTPSTVQPPWKEMACSREDEGGWCSQEVEGPVAHYHRPMILSTWSRQ